MKPTLWPWLITLAGLLIAPSLLAQNNTPQKPTLEERLAALLEKFPESDANQDGTLTQEEARAFVQKHKAQRDARPKRIEPTHADVAYGEHEKQRFDLWTVPDAEAPTPLALFIHGGGFRGGDKQAVSPAVVAFFREAGIAFGSMNYRLSDVGPYPIMMEDAARGLQTIRHRAEEWNLDPERIACYGGSAGAGISLWLAFHDDLADPDSEDPIARQSTRIVAAATQNGQSTYDIRTYREWFGVPDLPMHDALPAFYGVEKEEDWESERVIALMEDASAINHLSEDDTAPVYMSYGRPNTPVDATTQQGVWVHHVLLGLKLQEAMEKLGKECIVNGPDVTPEADPYGSVEKFIAAKLTQAD